MLTSAITHRRLGWFWAAVLLLGVIFTLWLQATAAQSSPSVAPLVVAPGEPPLDYAPGQVIVKLNPGIRLAAKRDVTTANAAVSTNNADLQQALSALGVSAADPVFTAGQASVGRTVNANAPLARLYRLSLMVR